MADSKLADRFATPNSSKLAQILLDLRGVDAQAGICNLQPTDVQLWPESFKSVRGGYSMLFDIAQDIIVLH